MKYLIMIYHTLNVRSELTEEQIAAGMRAHQELVADLRRSGELITADVLVDPAEGRRVLVRDGQVTVTDGPFPELNEHLAGVYLVECDSRERALEHAARIPEAGGGGVEVRQVGVEATGAHGWQDPSGAS